MEERRHRQVKQLALGHQLLSGRILCSGQSLNSCVIGVTILHMEQLKDSKKLSDLVSVSKLKMATLKAWNKRMLIKESYKLMTNYCYHL